MDTRLHEAADRWFRNAWPEYIPYLIRTRQKAIPQIETPTGLSIERYRQGRPDFVLERPNRFYHFLAIELKLPFGTRPEGRAAWQQSVEKGQGKYVSCHTLADFMQVVNRYMAE